MCYIDPAFDDEGTGTAGDDHPLADIRLGERFIADAYHALADNGYLDDTVFIVTFDEWGGFYDHVPPPQVIDDTNPANVMHAGDSTTPTDGQLIPNYRQLGFRVPGIVVSNLARPRQVVHEGPFEHCSSLALIESTFGLTPLTARDRHARNLQEILLPHPVPARYAVRPSSIPTSSDVIGPAISPPSESLLQVLEGTAAFDPADICSADSVQSVSPEPVNHPRATADLRRDPRPDRDLRHGGLCSGATAGTSASGADAKLLARTGGGPGEQLVAGEPVGVREGARRHHELVGAGARDELVQQPDDRGRVTDDVRAGCLRDHRLLGRSSKAVRRPLPGSAAWRDARREGAAWTGATIRAASAPWRRLQRRAPTR